MGPIQPSSPAQESLLKAKAIDQYLNDAAISAPSRPIVWPVGDPRDESANNYEAKGKGPTKDMEAAIASLGYEEAAPSVKSTASRAQPRRSSLRYGGGKRRASIGYTGEMALVLPSKDQAKKRPSVSFDDTKNEIHEIDTMASLTEHPERLWFQAEEYAHIRDKIYSIIDNEKPAKLCTRGLESLFSEDTAAERKGAYTSVLTEQTSQRQQGKYDAHSLSRMYGANTVGSKVLAATRAEKDEEDIVNYTLPTRRMMRRMTC